jgi:hypothetical protein
MTTTRVGWEKPDRLAGLRRFAIAITVFNILGHTVLGFEQSWAQPLISLASAYFMELVLEVVDAWAQGRPRRFAGGPKAVVEFLLSAHITSMAVSMLLYANEALWPVALASAVAIASKNVFRVSTGQGSRHFLNPSNFGITVTLLLFPWIGIAQPYQFTENLSGAADWILPAIIVMSGSFLNFRFTHRLPLIGAWLSCFVLQALFRNLVFGAPLAAALNPMMGVAFVLYTFYMVTDPATTPSEPQAQIAFGGAVAVTYGMLMMAHVVFGLFFALTIVCIVRGLGLYAFAWVERRAQLKEPATESAIAG